MSVYFSTKSKDLFVTTITDFESYLAQDYTYRTVAHDETYGVSSDAKIWLYATHPVTIHDNIANSNEPGTVSFLCGSISALDTIDQKTTGNYNYWVGYNAPPPMCQPLG